MGRGELGGEGYEILEGGHMTHVHQVRVWVSLCVYVGGGGGGGGDNIIIECYIIFVRNYIIAKPHPQNLRDIPGSEGHLNLQ